MSVEFEWDLSKESENLRKHKISFIEAVSTFKDPDGIKLIEVGHSNLESRFYWIGKSSKGRILTIRFTIRDEKFRIFGCAEWRKFRRLYYEATKA